MRSREETQWLPPRDRVTLTRERTRGSGWLHLGTVPEGRRVGHLVERHGNDPGEVAERYDVSLGDVHRALAS